MIAHYFRSIAGYPISLALLALSASLFNVADFASFSLYGTKDLVEAASSADDLAAEYDLSIFMGVVLFGLLGAAAAVGMIASIVSTMYYHYNDPKLFNVISHSNAIKIGLIVLITMPLKFTIDGATASNLVAALTEALMVFFLLQGGFKKSWVVH